MSVTHTVTRKYKDQSAVEVSLAEAVTSNYEKNADIALVGANQPVVYTITRANLKSLLIYCDKACTVYTNDVSGGSPQDTIAITAGQALVWTLAGDGLARCPFSGNVTAVYVTVGSGTGAFKMRSVHA